MAADTPPGYLATSPDYRSPSTLSGMINTWLTIGYFVLVGTVVVSRDQFLDNDLAVVAVAALVLFLGLGLWVFVAQKYRDH
jgi:NhaP-type Na+/H+ or K+/H+ antiporter